MNFITLYQACLTFGIIFVGLAAVGGLDGADFDTDFETDILGQAQDSQTPPAILSVVGWLKAALPLLNLRFWAFFALIFGLTGLLLTRSPHGLTPQSILPLAFGLGICFASGSVNILRWLRRDQSNTLIQVEDFAGAMGWVEIPFEAETRGKVKLEVAGSYLYMPARSSEARSFNVGDPILVVGLENNLVWVVADDRLDGKD